MSAVQLFPPKWNSPLWRGGGVWFLSLTKLMILRLWKFTDSGSSYSYKIHEASLQDDTNRKQLVVKTLREPLSDWAGNYGSCPFWGGLFGDAGTSVPTSNPLLVINVLNGLPNYMGRSNPLIFYILSGVAICSHLSRKSHKCQMQPHNLGLWTQLLSGAY